MAFWSPNGRYLAVGVGPNNPCSSCRADGHPYYAIRLAGSKAVSLGTALDEGAISWAQNASFAVLSSPLGRFTYDDKHLVWVDLATGARRALTRSPQWADTQPAVSPDGTRIAFVRGRGAPLSTHLTPQQLFGSRHVFLMSATGFIG